MLANNPGKITLLFLGIVILTSCSKLRKSWTAEDYQGRSFTKLAVFSVDADSSVRKVLEQAAIDQFLDADIDALPSSKFVSEEDLADSTLDKTISNLELDGILTISLVIQDSGNSVLPENYNKFSKFYSLRFTELNTQRYLTKEVEYVMEGVLYDLSESEQMVWRGEMALLDPENVEAKKRFIKRMLNELIEDGLILGSDR